MTSRVSKTRLENLHSGSRVGFAKYQMRCNSRSFEFRPSCQSQKKRFSSREPALKCQTVSYQVFARKYRPLTFDDVLGQDHVVRTLRNAIEQDRLAHAYLFVGPRGTGKTSTARIFAKALNCPGGPKVDFDPHDPLCEEIAEGNSLDVMEIDGASNNGVEQVRELRETVKFAPSSCKYKIYYIDEVHMLSTAAFNALLKTLEEPPAHVKFIFATTEPNKILPTIISRCQRFDLRRIPTQIIADHLLFIAKEEGIKLDQNAAYAIAKGADGGMRDAQSMLDQLVAFCGEHIEESNVLEIFGFTSLETIANLTDAVLNRKSAIALEAIHEESEKGKDLSRLLADWIGYLRNLLIAIVDPKNEFGDLAPEIAERIRAQVKLAVPERLLNLVDHLGETETRMKWAPNKRLHLEIAVIKAMQIMAEMTVSDVIGLLHQAGQSAEGMHAPLSPGAKTEVPNEDPKPVKKKPAGEVAPDPEPAGEGSPSSTKPEPLSEGETTNTEPPFDADPPKPESELSEKQSSPSKHKGNLTGQLLWDAVVADIHAQRPLMSGWTHGAKFIEHAGRNFVIGFSPEDRFSRDSMMREKSKIFVEELLEQHGGNSVTLQSEIRDTIPAPTPVVIEELNEPIPNIAPEAAEPEKSPENRTKAERPADPEPEVNSEPEIVEAEPPVDEEKFKNDPLIQEALRLFEAEVETTK